MLVCTGHQVTLLHVFITTGHHSPYLLPNKRHPHQFEAVPVSFGAEIEELCVDYMVGREIVWLGVTVRETVWLGE